MLVGLVCVIFRFLWCSAGYNTAVLCCEISGCFAGFGCVEIGFLQMNFGPCVRARFWFDRPRLLLCFAGCVYSAGWGLGFEPNFQGLGRRKQICSSIWDADDSEVDEAETIGFGRKKDYLI